LADILLLLISNFSVLIRPEAIILAGAGILVIVTRIYAVHRPALRLASMARTGYLLIMFTNVAAIFNYLLAGLLPLPRWDASFAGADMMLGLHWLSLYQFVVTNPLLDAASNIIYCTLSPEFLLLLLLFECSGQHRWGEKLRRYYMNAALATILLGILLPASGPFALYHLPIAKFTAYISQENGLRDGTMRLIDLSNVQGLVAFPSFHAALALLCAYAARRLRYLNWPLMALNIAIVTSAPVVGGHYFVDIFAGLALACVVIAAEHFYATSTQINVQQGGCNATSHCTEPSVGN